MNTAALLVLVGFVAGVLVRHRWWWIRWRASDLHRWLWSVIGPQCHMCLVRQAPDSKFWHGDLCLVCALAADLVKVESKRKQK